MSDNVLDSYGAPLTAYQQIMTERYGERVEIANRAEVLEVGWPNLASKPVRSKMAAMLRVFDAEAEYFRAVMIDGKWVGPHGPSRCVIFQ